MKRQKQLTLALAAFILTASAPAYADLAQQTKEAELYIAKWRAAQGDKRVEIEDKLAALLEQRAEALKTELKSNPKTLLQVALSGAITKNLPASLLGDLEKEAQVDGTVDQLIDYGSRATLQVRDRLGRKITLHCIDSPPALVKGSAVTAKGYQLQDQLVAHCGSGSLKSTARTGKSAEALAVNFSKPKQGDVLRGSVEVAAALPKDKTISAISFYKDGRLFGRRDTAPYTWLWNTAQDADGPHQLILRANDPDLNVGNASITAITDNTLPRIALISPSQRQNVSGSVVCEAKAQDALGVETVKFLIDGAAVAVIIQPPYALRWDSTQVANGPHSIEALAIDRAGNTAVSQAASIRVLNSNTAPVMAPIGSKSVFEGVSLSFSITAEDVDSRGGALTYKAENIPSWAKFDATSGRFFGTPGFSVASSSNPKVEFPAVTFEVCDTQPACVREAIAIAVKNVNRAPVVDPIASRELSEGDSIKIAPLVSEPDGDAFTCALINAPEWLLLDTKTCALSGSPSLELINQNSRAKNYRNILFRACDPEGYCADQSFSIIIRDAARSAHLVPIGDKTVDEGRVLKFTVRGSDPDEDPVALSAAGLPSGAAFKDAGDGTGVFSWAPLENQAGAYTVEFEATDQRNNERETITITVQEASLCISGMVQNSIGEAFANLKIEAANASTFTRTAETNSQGFYLIKDLSPGTYRVKPIFGTGLNLPGNEGYDFEPFYRQVKLAGEDQNLINFTAVSKE